MKHLLRSKLLIITFTFLVISLSFAQSDSGIYQSYVILDKGLGNQSFDIFSPTDPANNDLSIEDFHGAHLGTFIESSGNLILKGGQNNVWKCNATDNITSGWLDYTIYQTGSRPTMPSYFGINLNTSVINFPGAACSTLGDNQEWINNTANINVLDGLISGDYTLEVYSHAEYTVNGIPSSAPHYVNNNGDNFRATFRVDSPPTAKCHETLTLQLDSLGTVTISAADIDMGSLDDFDTPTLSIDNNTFNCFDVGTPQTVTLTVTDAVGQTDTCTTQVTVMDMIPPTLSTVSDRTENLDANCAFTIPDYTGLTTALDNCATPIVTQIPAIGTVISGAGTVQTITLSTTDGTSSTSTSFEVTLEDHISPTAICQDFTLTLDTSGNANIDVDDIDNGSYDNCGISSRTLNKTSFTCADIGTNTIILTVIDTSNNVSTCSATVTIIDLAENASVTITVDNQTICEGENPIFTAIPANAGANPIYEWFINTESQGTNSPSFEPYTTINDGDEVYVLMQSRLTSCDAPSQSNTITVDINPLPIVSGPLSLCIGNTENLTPAGSGWVSTSSFATVDNNGLVTPTSAGLATFTYTDANGCSSDLSINIFESPIISAAPISICAYETSSLAPTSGGTWSSNKPLIASITNSGLITGLSPGSVTFTFTDTNGCSATTNSVEVLKAPLFDPITVSDNPVCVGNPTILTANAQGLDGYAETIVNYDFNNYDAVDYSGLIDLSTTPNIESNFYSPAGENYLPYNTSTGSNLGAFTNNSTRGNSLVQIDDWKDGGVYGGSDDSGMWQLDVSGSNLVNYKNLRFGFDFRRLSKYGVIKTITVEYRSGNTGEWTTTYVPVQIYNGSYVAFRTANIALPVSFDNSSLIQFRLRVDDGSAFNECTEWDIQNNNCTDLENGVKDIHEPHIAIDNVQVQGSLSGNGTEYIWSADTGVEAGLPISATSPLESNNQITVNPEVTTQYTVTATNKNGCSATKTVTVNVAPTPTITISTNYCPEDDPLTPEDESQMVQLTATSDQIGTTWEWNTGDTSNSIYVDTAGQFQVIGTTANECSDGASMSVAQELIVNGDFSLGNTGFNTDYTYYPDIAGNSELIVNGYSITSDGNNVNPDFSGSDHTSGTGNFMAINGLGSSHVVWSQTVNVEDGIEYYFAAWARSLNDVGPFGKLRFRVNGNQVAQLNLGAYPANDWTRFYGSWISPVTGPVLIEIINNESSVTGNNFGIDDISFATLSTFINLTSYNGSDNQTVCENTPIDAISYEVGGGLTGPTITGLPAGLTSTFDGLQLSINGTPTESGTFNYTVNINASCGNKTLSGTLIVDPAPIITITPLPETVCASTGSIPLSANLSGSATSGTWSTSGTGTFNNINGTDTTYNFGLNETGSVSLTFMSNYPIGLCDRAIETVVFEITPYIIADANPNNIDYSLADCSSTTVPLNANNVTGQWSAIPDTGHFSNPTAYNTDFTGESGTSYTLTWTTANESPCLDTTDTLIITIPDCNPNIVFDGIDDYINFGDNYDLNSTFSIEAWIKADNVTGTKTIISKRNGTTLSSGYDLSLVNNRLNFRYNNINIIATEVINNSKWYHVAVTYNASSYTMYIDGFVVRNATVGTIPLVNTNNALIGAIDQTNNSPINYFKGAIDEVRIWNTALSKEQIREMMNQEIKANGANVMGEVIPTNISGDLKWNNLIGYYQMNLGPQTNVTAGYVNDISSLSPIPGKLNAMTDIQSESAPIPYISIRDNIWDDTTTWSANSIQQIPNSTINSINGYPQTWNIVRTKHNVNSGISNRTLLGLLVDNNTFTISNDLLLTVNNYLRIDGVLRLDGESQLLQDENAYIDYVNSNGYMERDQQGTANTFSYNYWGSPVTSAGIKGSRTYTLNDILYDRGSKVNWVTGHNGASGNPVSITSRWIYSFSEGAEDNISDWTLQRNTGTFNAALGFTMKGPGPGNAAGVHNHTFRGMPNNGDITATVTANGSILNQTLVGNPYASAIDANEFIKDNIPISVNTPNSGTTGSIDGTLYFWKQASENNSHVTVNYLGGYASYNLSGGTPAALLPGIGGVGDAGNLIPKRYIPVGQGFFVNAAAGQTSNIVKFKNSQRAFVKESPSSSVFFRGTAENVAHSDPDETIDNLQRIRINFTSPEGAIRPLLLAFTPDNEATDLFDYGYDALNTEILPSDMSFIIEDKKYIIQGVGEFDKTKVYPLYITLQQQGNIEIGLQDLESFDENIDVFIYDSEIDTYTRINDIDFQLNLEAGEYNNRFYIAFQEDASLSTSDKDFKETVVRYLYNTDEIYIKTPPSVKIKQLYLINVAGQTVLSWNATNLPISNEIKIPIRHISEGPYILKAETETSTFNKKLIIKY